MAQLGFADLLAQQPPVRVVDDYGAVGKGASQAHGVRCENGSEYLIKGPSLTRGHRYVAANELVAVRLARFLGLPVLDHEVAEMGGDMFFASRWMDQGSFSLSITQQLLSGCLNRERTYGIAVFDAWTCNVDRHHENLVVRHERRRPGQSTGASGGDVLMLNDHSHLLVLPGESPADLAGKASSAVSRYYRLDFLREALVDRSLFEDALNTAEAVSDEIITAIVASVPTPLLPDLDRSAYRNLLVTRRGLLRSLFAAEPGIFPNLR